MAGHHGTTLAVFVALMSILAVGIGMAGAWHSDHDWHAPNPVAISFPPSDMFVCSIDPNNYPVKPTDICKVSADNPARLILASNKEVISARYQWKTPVQLWKKYSRYVASFNAFYVVKFDSQAHRPHFRHRQPHVGGGGLAFALTRGLSVVGTGQESFGLFPINIHTGASLLGSKTKTVAVELDLARPSPTGFDPVAPHVGLDINSVKSVKTQHLGDPWAVIDAKIGVWIEYDALKKTLEVFVDKVHDPWSTPMRQNAKIAISYTGLDLAKEVNEYSYVGFGSRVPDAPNGAYMIYNFSFTTKWVLGNKVNY